MTKQISTSFILLICCTFQANATEFKFIAEDNGPVTKFCIAAAENDLKGLRNAIRKLRSAPNQQHSSIVNAVRCNDQIAAQFAHTYEASDTFAYLYKFTDTKHKTMVPVTSVEKVVASENEAGSPSLVYVHVRGK
jgi:hypothetical protein